MKARFTIDVEIEDDDVTEDLVDMFCQGCFDYTIDDVNVTVYDEKNGHTADSTVLTQMQLFADDNDV